MSNKNKWIADLLADSREFLAFDPKEQKDGKSCTDCMHWRINPSKTKVGVCRFHKHLDTDLLAPVGLCTAFEEQE